MDNDSLRPTVNSNREKNMLDNLFDMEEVEHLNNGEGLLDDDFETFDDFGSKEFDPATILIG